MIASRIVPSTQASHYPIGSADRLAENRRLDSEEGFHVEMSGSSSLLDSNKCRLAINNMNSYLRHKRHLRLPERRILNFN